MLKRKKEKEKRKEESKDKETGKKRNKEEKDGRKWEKEGGKVWECCLGVGRKRGWSREKRERREGPAEGQHNHSSNLENAPQAWVQGTV